MKLSSLATLVSLSSVVSLCTLRVARLGFVSLPAVAEAGRLRERDGGVVVCVTGARGAAAASPAVLVMGEACVTCDMGMDAALGIVGVGRSVSAG